ncbi:MAG: ROK family protein [Acidimicrobiia bacterium]|nr:ROK family protein [Acidimicrobiia bacterium]
MKGRNRSGSKSNEPAALSPAIGVDIGGTKLLAVRLESGQITDELKTTKPDNGAQMVDAIIAAYSRLAAGHNVAALGVGVAGLVDFETGTFVWGPHVDGVNIAVRDELEAALNHPVAVDNDANTTALAEHRAGAGQGSAAMLMVTLGTGIGGSMVIDGSLYRGRGFAGEFGHARFARGEYVCDCGQSGCWETEAAGPALERLARELILDDPNGSLATVLEGQPNGPEISEAAIAGDPQAIALISQVGRNFGHGLASLITMFDPDRVVVGGGLGSIGDVLLDPIRISANEARYAADYKELPDIVGAQLGEHAGAVGAALLGLEETNGNE